MKLIYVANVRLPDDWAHSIQIMKMCEAFAGQGIEVELLISRRRNAIKEDPFDYHGIDRNFQLTKLPAWDFLPGSPKAWYFWWRMGIFLLLAKLFLIFKHYDFLYTREQAAGLIFNDFILEIHSIPERIKFWHKKVWRKAAKLIVLTSFIKERLISEGIDGNKILIVPDAVDLKKFNIDATKERARLELALPPDKKIVMYVGSFYLHDWKGVDILLEAVKLFEESWVLVLVGGEPNELEQIKSPQFLG